MNYFSAFNRQALIAELGQNQYDLAIIGGGITGAGIALDAASRGLSVALVEMQDFAAGTSSRSTKLIHGGLRYLKQMEFNLVREVGQERAIVYHNAPHLVAPEKLILPIIDGGSFGELASSLGLMLYDWLANVEPQDQRVMLSKNQTLKKEPLLRQDILKGAGYYAEYRTDDARLTLEVMKTAAQNGAHCASYVLCEDFKYTKDTISGIHCKDQLTGSKFTVNAAQIVNASGPWVDKVRKKDCTVKGKRLHLTKGVHIIVPRERMEINNSIYFDVSDGRMIFAIPRQNVTYIGTTDTNYKGNYENPQVTKGDVDYLLNAVNKMFPTVGLLEKDIVSSYAGLRPLIHEDGKSPSELSRKDELFISKNGLISIAGGKLTGYRQMAKRTVDLVHNNLNNRLGPPLVNCKTDKIQLLGGDFNKPDEVIEYIQQIAETCKKLGLAKENAERMVRTFGTQSTTILSELKTGKNDAPEEELVKAEVRFCVNFESCFSLNDFFLRRTARVYFHPGKIVELLKPAAQEIKAALNFTDQEMENQIMEVKTLLKSTTTFL